MLNNAHLTSNLTVRQACKTNEVQKERDGTFQHALASTCSGHLARKHLQKIPVHLVINTNPKFLGSSQDTAHTCCVTNPLPPIVFPPSPLIFTNLMTSRIPQPRPSSYPQLGPKHPLLGTIYPQLRVQGGSWN